MTENRFAATRRFAAAFAFAATAVAAPLHAQASASAAAPSRVWNAAEVSQAPQLANELQLARRVSHSYPAALLDSQISGRATVQLVVGSTGRIEQVEGIAATHPAFAAAASRYVSAMRVRAATVDGRAVRCRVTVPVDFALAAG